MDCVTSDGEGFVAYAATLRWNGLRLGYTSTLTSLAEEPPHSRTSLRFRAPKSDGNEISWAGLGASAAWKMPPESPPLRETFGGPAASLVEWDCVAPRSPAFVDLAGRRRLTGVGYVEHLTTTVAPWKMGLRELRWGRFHGDRGSTIVWIDAKGEDPFRRVYLDGQRDDAAIVADDHVELPAIGGRLAIEPETVLRTGRLRKTALAAWPLAWLLPEKALALDETKLCGPASLSRPGQDPESGMALYEVVRWP